MENVTGDLRSIDVLGLETLAQLAAVAAVPPYDEGISLNNQNF
jgi:hypothetical protein